MKNWKAAPWLVAVVCFVGGAAVGRWSPRRDDRGARRPGDASANQVETRRAGQVASTSGAASASRLNDVLALSDVNERARGLGRLLAEWARRDPAAAKAALARIAGAKSRAAALEGFARGWLAVDFAAAREWILGLSADADRGSVMPALLQAWAQRDVGAARAFVASLPAGNEQTALYGQLAQGWAETDPRGAAGFAAALSSRRLREQALRESLAVWVKSDPAAALAFAAQLTPRFEGTARLFELWAQDDLAAAARHVAQAGRGVDAGAVGAVAREWSRRDPRGLPGWLGERSLRPLDLVRVLDDIVVPVLENDRDAGVALLRLAPSVVGAPELYARATENLARTDLAWTREWLRSIPQPENQKAALEVFASAWSYQRPENAAAWAMELPANLQPVALKQVVANWSLFDPLEAADFVTKRIPAEQQFEHLRHVMQNWSLEDPAGIADWVSRFPTVEIRDQLIGTVVSRWMERDPAQADRWIRSLPPEHPVRTTAIEPFFRATLNRDPQRALEWLVDIADMHDSTNQHRVAYAALRWYYDAPAQARQWLQSTPLVPVPIKADYLARMSKGN